MNMTNSKEIIIQQYMDSEGMVTKDQFPGPWSTGNGLMHTGLFICFLFNLKQLEELDKIRFFSTVKGCEDEPGLYDRNKGRNDENAHDDATGVVAGSVVSDLMFHKDVLKYGQEHGFSYNNVNPGVFIDDVNPLKWEWWSLRLRFPHHILWYYIVNNKLGFLAPLLALYLYISSRKKVGYSHLLNYQILISSALKNKFIRKLYKYLFSKIKLVESCEDYFGTNHEMTRIAQEVKIKNDV